MSRLNRQIVVFLPHYIARKYSINYIYQNCGSMMKRPQLIGQYNTL